MNNKAIFFDRDGVLIEDTHLISKLDQVKYFNNIDSILNRLRKMEYKLFLITNQSVVARGLIQHQEAMQLNRDILKNIFDENVDQVFTDIFLCPHHPHADVPEFRKECNYRKPGPGFLNKAIARYNLDSRKCFMVGDRSSDIIAGNLAGCSTILIKSGQHNSPLVITKTNYKDDLLVPNFSIDSLEQIFSLIKF